MSARLPNFFIVGAARCGTTLLHGLLQEHPQVYMGVTKEPTFFCDKPQQIKNPVRYYDDFRNVRDETAIGESSVAYLSHPETPEVLKGYFPDSKVIAIVRNPADRARALYLLMRAQSWESKPTFEQALAAEDRRSKRKHFPIHGMQQYENFMYFRSGLFGEQIARYYDNFERSNVYVTTLYDLTMGPDKVLGEIYDFLGVDRVQIPELEKVNPSVWVKSFPLRVVERQFFHRLSMKGVPLTGAIQEGLRRINETELPPYLPETRAALLEKYMPDLDRFTSLTGVDILAAEQRKKDRAAESEVATKAAS